MIEDYLRSIRRFYFMMPNWSREVIGNCYAMLPLKVRMGNGYSEFKKLLFYSKGWSREDQDAYQFRELKKTIANAYDQIPFYRRHFSNAGVTPSDFRCLEDINLFPFVTKSDIKNNFDEMVNVSIPPLRHLVTTTGGSTAEPMRFLHIKGVTRSKEKAFIHDQWEKFGYFPRARTVQFKGRDVGLPSRKIFWEHEPIDNFLEMNSNYLTEDNIPYYLEAIYKYAPLFMIGYVSSVYLLARFLRLNPEYKVPRLSAIFLASENVYKWQRDELVEIFRCPISSHYGHSEMVLLGSECPFDRQLHFYPQYGFLELINESGGSVKEAGSIGEIVGTSFDNPLMPFIRYKTQDLGVLGKAGCKCHEHYPVLSDVEGRLQEFIMAKDGRLISICVMGAAHFDNLDNVFQTQYFQDKPGELVFRVVPRDGFADADRVSIAQAIAKKVGEGVAVRVDVVDEIARTRSGKHMMLEQKIPIDVLSHSQDHVLVDTSF